MASVSHIREFIQKWEGGLSRNTDDGASSNPAPWPYKGVSGYHTNKGVTYTTFSGQASKLGYANTADNFFSMPDSIWNTIIKNAYWDVWYLDKMNSQAIADLLLDFSWGSGPYGSFKSVQKWLSTQKKIVVSSRLEAVEAINKLAALNEKAIFLELIDWRAAFFKGLSTYVKFGKGWMNRLNSLKEFGLETIAKKKT